MDAGGPARVSPREGPFRPRARVRRTSQHRRDRRAILHDVSLALLELAPATRVVDKEELRAELQTAQRMGFDWRALYAEAASPQAPLRAQGARGGRGEPKG